MARKKGTPGVAKRIAATGVAKRIAAQYKKLPGSAGRYQNLKTGEDISRRQYEKLLHGGRTIEQRARERRSAGVPPRKQKPRAGVLERLGGFFNELGSNLRETFTGLARKLGLSPTTAKRRAEAGVLVKRRGKIDISESTGLFVYGYDASGGLVKVEVSRREGSRVGYYKKDAYQGRFPRTFKFAGLDGAVYTLPNKKLGFERLTAEVKALTGKTDIVDDKAYNALNMKEAA